MNVPSLKKLKMLFKGGELIYTLLFHEIGGNLKN